MEQNYNLVELNGVEKFFYYGSVFGDELVNSIAILDSTTETDADVNLHDEVVRQAMYFLYKRHPLFRAHVHVDEATKEVYFAIPKKEEDKSVQDMKFQRSKVSTRAEMISSIERFNAEPFKSGNQSLFWKLQLLDMKENDKNVFVITVVIPQYATDGINIQAISIELVNVINSLLQNTICNEMVEKLELYDNINEIVKKHNLIEPHHAELYEKYRKNRQKLNFILPNSFKNLKEKGFKINLLSFDVDFTSRLKIFSKTNGITVNSVITAAAFYAFKDLYEENHVKMPKDVSVFEMVSLRFRVEPKIDFSHVRDCTTGFSLELEYPNFGKYENFIEDCKYIGKMVLKNIEERSNLDWLWHVVNTEIEIFKKYPLNDLMADLDNERYIDFVISNNGTHVADSKKVLNGPLRINELYYGDCLESYPTMHCPFILHLHTFNDRLMIQLSSNRTRINSKLTDRFMILYETHLRKFVSQ